MVYSSSGKDQRNHPRGGGLYTASLKRRKPGARTLACVISKKVAARAVDRNKAKRVCRAVFTPGTKGLGDMTLMVHIRRGALSASHRELAAEATRLMQPVIKSQT